MAFHHDKSGRASFRSKPAPGARPAKPNGPSPLKKPHHEEAQPAHDAHTTEKHVTETHPGKTQPHHVTGVHAHHVHHSGGGKYSTHTHHDDGTVESKDNLGHQEMVADRDAALPPDEETAENEMPSDGGEYAGDLAGGIGGEAV